MTTGDAPALRRGRSAWPSCRRWRKPTTGSPSRLSTGFQAANPAGGPGVLLPSPRSPAAVLAELPLYRGCPMRRIGCRQKLLPANRPARRCRPVLAACRRRGLACCATPSAAPAGVSITWWMARYVRGRGETREQETFGCCAAHALHACGRRRRSTAALVVAVHLVRATQVRISNPTTRPAWAGKAGACIPCDHRSLRVAHDLPLCPCR